METMYETNYHYNGEKLSHFTVTPIQVIRRGVLEGCSTESITAIGSDGRRFNGSARNYFETEEKAWESIRVELVEGIEATEKEINKQRQYLEDLREVLRKMPINKKQGDQVKIKLKDQPHIGVASAKYIYKATHDRGIDHKVELLEDVGDYRKGTYIFVGSDEIVS